MGFQAQADQLSEQERAIFYEEANKYLHRLYHKLRKLNDLEEFNAGDDEDVDTRSEETARKV